MFLLQGKLSPSFIKLFCNTSKKGFYFIPPESSKKPRVIMKQGQKNIGLGQIFFIIVGLGTNWWLKTIVLQFHFLKY